MTIRPCFPALAAVFLFSCTYPRSQSVVEIYLDEALVAHTTEIEIEITTSRTVFRKVVAIDAATAFPLRFPVTAARGDSGRTFTVVAQAREVETIATGMRETLLAINRLRGVVPQGAVNTVPLWILANCTCDDTQRCERGETGTRCVSLDDPLPTMDAGIDAPFADVAVDERAIVDARAENRPFDATAFDGPRSGVCPDPLLSSELGAAVFAGTTLARGDDYMPSCGTNGEDVVHVWRAPHAGRYNFDLVGNNTRTIELRRGASCSAGEMLACDNGRTTSNGATSVLSQVLADNETVLVVIDGPNAGDYAVNIWSADFVASSWDPAQEGAGRNTYAQRVCRCFSALGYPSEAECIAARSWTTRMSNCFTTGAAGVTDRSYYACRNAGLNRTATCASAQSSCDDVKFCDDVFAAARAVCPAGAGSVGDVDACAVPCPTTSSTEMQPIASGVLTESRRFNSTCSAFGPEISVRWTPTAFGLYEVSSADSTFANVLGVASACGTYSCNPGVMRQTVNVSSAAPSAILTVRAQLASATGTYRLNARAIACPTATISGITYSGTFSAEAPQISASCFASGSGPDAVLAWTPATTGRYLVTLHSSVRATLSRINACATRTVSSCSNTNATGDVSIAVSATAATPLYFLVDAEMGTTAGDYRVDISDQVPCTAVALTTSSISANIVDFQDVVSPPTSPCRFTANNRDAIYRWLAPLDGSYQVTTFGSNFDTIIGIYSGSTCGDIIATNALACNDDYHAPDGGIREVGVAPGGSTDSLVTFAATAGQSYLFVVNSYTGSDGTFNLMVVPR